MKKYIALLLALSLLLLTGCTEMPEETQATQDLPPVEDQFTRPAQQAQVSGQMVDILLDGQTITLGGDAGTQTGNVFISRDIVYYENRTQYDSGNPYGNGTIQDMHTMLEAVEHMVVNITAPGNYRLRGKLDLGQIRIDLGEKAASDPNAVVNLILDGVDITCTVGPAILVQNVYECDGDRTAENASADVDTLAAGVNLILAEGSNNTVSGSYVAKIYQDAAGEQKLCKQDGAIYSYMSMNVFGPGQLTVNAENEGLDTERHLTIHGGDITIHSQNDGINTNADGISVTTILGGNLYILAGLGEEGDGIDSNGYLVIWGGTVAAAAHPASDAGLDSDLGTFIHGGEVYAFGSGMGLASEGSRQVVMNLQFAEPQQQAIVVAQETGTLAAAWDWNWIGEEPRSYSGVVISGELLQQGERYQLYLADEVTMKGVADLSQVQGAVQMAYTGTNMPMAPGIDRPGINVTPPGHMPEPPEGDAQIPPQPSQEPPEQIPGSKPEDQSPPEGQNGTLNTVFWLEKTVNGFTGVRRAE